MVGYRRDGRSGGSDDRLVGDPLVDLVDDLPHGLEVAELDVTSKAPIPSDVTRLAMFLIMPSSTASATLPPRGRGGPLDPKMVFRGHCEGVLGATIVIVSY